MDLIIDLGQYSIYLLLFFQQLINQENEIPILITIEERTSLSL
ncbi:MAG: hypothetical protein HLUCCX10_12525 [Algoriphagus marincola HL-49]|uniref:Uncharacterized protein n=1 Tax=Algoriphagus marincola HL-49 TaxID=1305737 RepID=A0A0N8KFA5_9BACT|nr:MAG: hypothetical protein HLUCCX10_12525 [Algoriphagus marincola HL-49]